MNTTGGGRVESGFQGIAAEQRDNSNDNPHGTIPRFTLSTDIPGHRGLGDVRMQGARSYRRHSTTERQDDGHDEQLAAADHEDRDGLGDVRRRSGAWDRPGEDWLGLRNGECTGSDAEAAGYFEAEGLEVALESFTSGPLIREGLNGGTLDMAYIGVPPIVHWVAKGADLVIVAKVNYGQASLMARRDAGITRVEDLAGRRLAGVREKSGMDVLLRGYVLGEVGGLAPSNLAAIETMPVAEMGPALEAGNFDAAFMWEPFVARMLARRSARVVLNVNRVEPYYPWYVIAARREFVDAHPERVKSVLRAHRRAITHLNSSPNAGNAVIAEAFALEEETGPDGKVYSPEEIVKRARSRLGWEWDLNEDDRDFIERLMGWSTSLGFIKAPLDIESLLDLGPLRRVRRERR